MEEAELVLMGEFTYSERTIDVNTLLSWLAGERFRLGVSKAFTSQDKKYDPRGQPVFMTGANRIHIADQRKHNMVNSRIVYFDFHRERPPDEIREIPDCPRCFARFYLGDGDTASPEGPAPARGM